MVRFVAGLAVFLLLFRRTNHKFFSDIKLLRGVILVMIWIIQIFVAISYILHPVIYFVNNSRNENKCWFPVTQIEA